MQKNSIFGKLAGGLAASAILVAALALPCSAGPLIRDRFAISPERVSSVLQQAGIRAKSAQVEFLSPVSSMAENPQLTVVSVARWREGKLKALLRCRNNRECLPFYVVLHDNDMTGPVSVNFLNAIQGEFSTKQKTRKRSAEKLLVRGGQRATLIMKNRNLRITLPVLCLENGKRGETIRLSSPDRKQKYTGEVVEAGLLEGNF
ncbi:MAG TPA: flagella basal body P-ring formation protein FlgA [Terriglobales bacterium]|nr:flagella basal body P-ring formation protein FlgA [Terriglobales bacterium]